MVKGTGKDKASDGEGINGVGRISAWDCQNRLVNVKNSKTLFPRIFQNIFSISCKLSRNARRMRQICIKGLKSCIEFGHNGLFNAKNCKNIFLSFVKISFCFCEILWINTKYMLSGCTIGQTFRHEIGQNWLFIPKSGKNFPNLLKIRFVFEKFSIKTWRWRWQGCRKWANFSFTWPNGLFVAENCKYYFPAFVKNWFFVKLFT